MDTLSQAASQMDPPIVVDEDEKPSIFHEENADENMHEQFAEEEGVHPLGEDAIRKTQKMDYVGTISSLRILPHCLSRRKVPLCRLVPMPMVRPTLSCDLIKLEQEFTHGYDEGARVFHAFVSDEQRDSGFFSDAEKADWGPIWNKVNYKFNVELSNHVELRHLVDAKFYLCDRNHRRIT